MRLRVAGGVSRVAAAQAPEAARAGRRGTDSGVRCSGLRDQAECAARGCLGAVGRAQLASTWVVCFLTMRSDTTNSRSIFWFGWPAASSTSPVLPSARYCPPCSPLAGSLVLARPSGPQAALTGLIVLYVFVNEGPNAVPPMKRSIIPCVGCGQGEVMARRAAAAATSGYPGGVLAAEDSPPTSTFG